MKAKKTIKKNNNVACVKNDICRQEVNVRVKWKSVFVSKQEEVPIFIHVIDGICRKQKSVLLIRNIAQFRSEK